MDGGFMHDSFMGRLGAQGEMKVMNRIKVYYAFKCR
jgi:hypothetical protein